MNKLERNPVRQQYNESKWYSVFDSFGERTIVEPNGNMYRLNIIRDERDYSIEIKRAYPNDKPDILINNDGDRFYFREPEYDSTHYYQEDVTLIKNYIDYGADVLVDTEGRRFFFRRNYDENGRPIIDNEGDEVLSRIYIDLV